MALPRLTRAEARRIALRAQLLDADAPALDLVSLVRRLTFLPRDMTNAVAPSADLVAWTRMGSRYSTGDLVGALADRELFEYDAMVRAMDDLPLHLAAMAEWPPWERTRDWLAANEQFAAEVLDELDDADGPLLARDIHATAQVPWQSSGWNAGRNVSLLLENLMMRGEVAVDGRRGNQRLWVPADRVYPRGVDPVPLEEATRILQERRLAALGIARASGTAIPGDPIHVGETGVEVEVEGTRGTWRVDPEQLDRVGEAFAGRAALLSPFDRLVHDRVRMSDLFEFDYTLEMYKPAAKRRWGYFALPVLYADRLVGKLDVTADRKAGRFFVDALHEDETDQGPWTATMRAETAAEVTALADWLELPLEWAQ